MKRKEWHGALNTRSANKPPHRLHSVRRLHGRTSLLYAVTIGCGALLTSVSAKADNFVTDTLPNLTPSEKQVLTSSRRARQERCSPNGYEILNYRGAVNARLEQIDSEQHCAESLWAIGTNVGEFVHKWLCTDTASGITGKTEVRGVINYPKNDPEWNCAWVSSHNNQPTFPAGRTKCYNLHWSTSGTSSFAPSPGRSGVMVRRL